MTKLSCMILVTLNTEHIVIDILLVFSNASTHTAESIERFISGLTKLGEWLQNFVGNLRRRKNRKRNRLAYLQAISIYKE